MAAVRIVNPTDNSFISTCGSGRMSSQDKRRKRPMLARINTSENLGNAAREAAVARANSAAPSTTVAVDSIVHSAPTQSMGFRSKVPAALDRECISNRTSEPDLSTAAKNWHFQPSEILPGFLYLGPEISTLEEVNYLRKLGIKRILNAASEVELGGGKHLALDDARQSGFERYLKLPLIDNVEATGVQWYIEQACSYLDDARLHSAPTYVHCKAGKSRSVMLVMAYLIHYNRWTLEQAYAYVAERRKSISPNLGFVSELMTFQEKRLRKDEREIPTTLLARSASVSVKHLAKEAGLAVNEDGVMQSNQLASAAPSSNEYRTSFGRWQINRPPADERLQAPNRRTTLAAVDSEHHALSSATMGQDIAK